MGLGDGFGTFHRNHHLKAPSYIVFLGAGLRCAEQLLDRAGRGGAAWQVTKQI